MKSFVIAAAAALTLGIPGAAFSYMPAVHSVRQVGVQARNGVVLPSQRPAYLAGNSSVLPSQRPAYLA
jgi:hypothetical protein